MDALTLAFAAAYGLVVGSFLNVVIWRLPRGQNLSKPRSRCPKCNNLIRWFDNIPVVSWLALGAKCRKCKTRISARYPFVELLTGALFVATAWRYGFHLPTAALISLALAALVSISFIDWDLKIIPDAISKPGIALGIVLAPLMDNSVHPENWLAGMKPALNQILHASAGAAVGAAIILAVRAFGTWVMKKEAMGLGDVKLLAFIGAIVGPLPVVYVFVLSCFLGAILGGILFFVGKRRTMPLDASVSHPEGASARFQRGKLSQEGLIRFPLADTTEDSPYLPSSWSKGDTVKLQLTLPADRVLEETDVQMMATGTVQSAQSDGLSIQLGELDKLHADDLERLDMFRSSYRYIPFGPFLSIAGAVVILWGPLVHHFVTVGYPSWVRSLSG